MMAFLLKVRLLLEIKIFKKNHSKGLPFYHFTINKYITNINHLKFIIMKKLFFFIVFLFVTTFSFAQVSVRGYYRSNGTYVQPHQRTAPNYTRNDNYSTIGNTNPYTGKAGTQPRDGYTTSSSYSAPTYSNTYAASSYSLPSTTYSSKSYGSNNTTYTGSRGGEYYINSNGNKTYVRRN
jgi:hypothetical protein